MNLDNYKASRFPVKIPSNFEFQVDDYHEFRNIQHILKTTVGLNYKFEEVGCDGKYYAVFWIGKKPIQLIKATKKSFEDYVS